jgi:hypothetical protein
MQLHMTVTNTAAAVTSTMTHQRIRNRFLALILAGEHGNSTTPRTAPWPIAAAARWQALPVACML